MEPLGSWTAAQTQRSFPSKSSKRHFWAKQRKRKYHLQQAERDGRHDAPEVSVGASLAGNGVDSENSEKAARLHAESTLARTLESTIDATRDACIRGMAPPVHDGTATSDLLANDR